MTVRHMKLAQTMTQALAGSGELGLLGMFAS